jgi:formate hydrogenlyase transcriptional activator
VGRSPALMKVLEKVKQVAPTDATVLLWGETGTGKELFARALHSASRRRDRPLIKVNCAALPTGLVESELFGHERGAFSGAIQRRVGRFELASGGTIFLDEIGEVPLEVQVKLLRVLQEHEFERVGGNTPIKTDVRVIAATNRDLKQAVREGKFREDLYYRLNVFPIDLPPLRERAGDIPLLVQFLIKKFAARIGKRIEGVSAETMERLGRYPWPGNVRELENILERAVILTRGPLLEVEPEVLAGAAPAPGGPAFAAGAARHEGPPAPPARGRVRGRLEALEREHILAVLEETDWVIEGDRGAARILQIHPNTLRSRLKKLGIRRSSPEKSS